MRSCTFFRVTCFPLVWAPCKFTYSGQPIGFEHPQIPLPPKSFTSHTCCWLRPFPTVETHRIPSPNPSDPCRPGYLRSFISEPTKMLWLSAVSQSNLCMQDVCLLVPEKQSRQTSLSLQPQIITVDHKKKERERERTETFTLKTKILSSLSGFCFPRLSFWPHFLFPVFLDTTRWIRRFVVCE